MLGSFFKDSLIYSAPAIISRGLTLFLIPFYTRVLDPKDFGSFDLFIAFATLVNMTIALEISQGVARFYAAEQDQKNKMLYASSAFWFTALCNFVFLIIMWTFSDKVSVFIMGQPQFDLTFKIGLIYIFSNGLFYLIQSQLRWELRSKEYAAISILMAFSNAVVGVWLAYFQKMGIIGLLIGMSVGSILGGILGFWWLKNSFRFCFSTNKLKEMLYFSSPLVLSGIAVWSGMYVDRLMINYFLTIEEVGIYGVGYRISSIAGLAIFGFQGALTPLVFANYQKKDTPEKLEKIFRFFLFFALMIFLILTLFSSNIMVLMTTTSYHKASSLMIILVPAVLLASMYIFSPGITIAKKTHYIMLISVSGGVLNVILNYILIPLIGIHGAGLSTLISYAVIFVLYTILGQRLYYIPHNWIRIFLITSITFILAFLIPNLYFFKEWIWIINLITIAFFVYTSFTISLINKDEFLLGWKFINEQILNNSFKK